MTRKLNGASRPASGRRSSRGRRAVGLSLMGSACLLLSACANPLDPSQRLYDPLGTPNYDVFGGVSAPIARSIGRFAVDDIEVLDVRENRYPDTYVQRTIYENPTSLPGENYLEASVRLRTGPVWATDPSDRWEAPTQTEIATRLREDFPGIRMAISGDLRRNGFGIYNHAIGEAGGRAACIFAWQDANAQRLPRDVDGLFIEFRYCDRSRSPEELVGLFDGLSLGY
ncbi:cellulose biosynthesis protein BcsN [Fodinicurvata sp. EGI_FJ10296]|uniref:cellulose biosynthesis protein BcsN n=1 Tax=Fodinicurvata sp. EGI_FJ10296 TaxID=3231908 RepID=UPI003455DD19